MLHQTLSTDLLHNLEKLLQRKHLINHGYFSHPPDTGHKLNHYSLCCFSIPPKNIRKPLGFMLFSGGIEKQHRAVMG